MPKMINTVLGPISPDQMGAVLCHEHVLFGYPGFQGDETADAWDEERFFRGTGAEDEMFGGVEQVIERIKKQGIGTIVDATANDCGRNVELLRKVSQRCGIHIVCSTGYYYEHGGAPAYWRTRRGFGLPVDEEIYDMMKTELNVGVAKIGSRAGVIKVGTGIGVFSDYERALFKAASRLAREGPDVRIMTHCSHGTMLKEQAEFFVEEGVNPKQVQLGHFCDTVDITVQMDVLKKGFYAGFDRLGQVGFDGMPYDDHRFAAICALTAAGFGDQILLSNDRLYWIFGREYSLPDAFRNNCLKEWHWTYIFEKVLPTLQKMGLTEEQTLKFMYQNPQRFHGGE